jgi:hydrogenase expression/formation protein HypC
MCVGAAGRLVEILNEELRLATVEVAGVSRCVSLAMLPDEDVEPGDWVLVHVGFAVARIDEQEALLNERLQPTVGL